MYSWENNADFLEVEYNNNTLERLSNYCKIFSHNYQGWRTAKIIPVCAGRTAFVAQSVVEKPSIQMEK